MDHASKVLSMQMDEPAKVQEVVDVVTTAKLITEVVTAVSETVTATSITIFAVEPQVRVAAITSAALLLLLPKEENEWLSGILKRNQLQSYLLIPSPRIKAKEYWRKRLMRADELHRFSDGTLNDVRFALHDIVACIRMEYLSMRIWSNLDKKKARVKV
nr:hypothetical protein [Tanacetum cinerariifolium]